MTTTLILPNAAVSWLTDYKAYGEDSYVYKDKTVYGKMCYSQEAANDLELNGEALEYLINNDTYTAKIGPWFAQMYNISTDTLNSLTTIDSVIANAKDKITNSTIAMNAVNNSPSALQKYANS